jgi:leucine-rich repeat protein SHOC2
MKKIEELFETLSDPQLIIDGLKAIDVEAINKYWLSGKLQQPKGEDEGKSEIKRLLMVAFAPDNSLPAMYRNTPRLRTSPTYKSDFQYYRNEENFEPAGTLTITKEFEVIPTVFYPSIFEALETKILRIATDAYDTHFSTGKIEWLNGVKELQIYGNFFGRFKLSSLPENLGDLKDLEELTIIRTEISAIPESLYQLSKLKKLDLRQNKIASLGSEISNLKSLEWLDVSLNRLERIPEELEKLTSLKELFVYDNPFKEINDFIAFNTYEYNYTTDKETKQHIELKYPKDVLVINKSWLEIPLNRIEEIITTHQVKTLRVESVAMLNRILAPEAVNHFSKITTLDLQWNNWVNYQYERGFFKDMHVRINLPSNEEAKIKELPEGIGLMTWLEEVNLYGNKIEKLPESFFKLKNLKKLNLKGNRIAVLPDLFASLSELTHLNLGSIEFSVIPESIFSLKNLVHLDLSWNRNLAVLSPFIGNLANLEELYLETNLIQELPKEFSNLTKLKKLTLNRNEFSSFPESLLNLPQLEELFIGNRKMTSFATNLSGLSNLKILDLEESELPSIPDSIGGLKNLETLNLKQNKITSISEEIKQCSQLKNLNLQQNALLDKLPEAIGGLTKLESFNLYQCKMIQVLPKSISNLSNLKILDLSFTLISELPDSIYELKSLVELKLFELPIIKLSPAIKNLENLEYLDLRLTKITELPSEIGELKKLTKLDGCILNKPLPDSFCDLTNLKELDIDFENVEKPLPENFGNLINLERFDPGNNIGYLPASFAKLSKLKTLTIRNSTFTVIPMVLTELHNLKSLDLWDNKFADVPNELTNLKSLDLIRFDNNPLASSTSIQKKCRALLPGVEFSF